MSMRRRTAWLMDIVWRDLRYAFRGMRRTPAFTAVALAIVAIAIGANTAIFSVVEALLYADCPYRDADFGGDDRRHTRL